MKAYRSKLGMTLVEVVIATALTGIGTIGLYSAGIFAHRLVHETRVRNVAVQLARQELENIVADGFDTITTKSLSGYYEDRSSLVYMKFDALPPTQMVPVRFDFPEPVVTAHDNSGNVVPVGNALAMYIEVQQDVGFDRLLLRGQRDTNSLILLVHR